jgi:nitroreductase
MNEKTRDEVCANTIQSGTVPIYVVDSDVYQKRYVAHQERKRREITEGEGEMVAYDPFTETELTAFNRRRSQRIFNKEAITETQMRYILKAATMSPSSCNRHGIKIKFVTERSEKELLGGLLVGGVGWIHRAYTIALFFADPKAYASPREKDFMHYCDVGFLAMTMWLAAETQRVGVCYVNPNVSHPDVFRDLFAPAEHIFCGALALGHYDRDKRAKQAERPEINEMLI